MSEVKLAIITGADGGMGTEITRAVATGRLSCNYVVLPLARKSRVGTATFSERDGKHKTGSHGSRSVFHGLLAASLADQISGTSSPRFFADE